MNMDVMRESELRARLGTQVFSETGESMRQSEISQIQLNAAAFDHGMENQEPNANVSRVRPAHNFALNLENLGNMNDLQQRAAQGAVGLDAPGTRVTISSLAGQSNDDGFAMAFDD